MFLYLIAVSGIMIQLHYCGANLESWNVFAKSDGCDGGECGDESSQSDDCCKDEVVTAKVSHEQNVAEAVKLKLSPLNWVAISTPQQWLPYKVASVQIYNTLCSRPNAPPGLWQQIPLFKLHSSFTYYG